MMRNEEYELKSRKELTRGSGSKNVTHKQCAIPLLGLDDITFDIVGGRNLVGDENASLSSNFCLPLMFPLDVVCNILTKEDLPEQPPPSPQQGGTIGGALDIEYNDGIYTRNGAPKRCMLFFFGTGYGSTVRTTSPATIISGDVPSSIPPNGVARTQGGSRGKFHHTRGLRAGITRVVTVRLEPTPPHGLLKPCCTTHQLSWGSLA
ncbi:hypothetical protein LXL04_039362 [Taraxacum kok-saghyz]